MTHPQAPPTPPRRRPAALRGSVLLPLLPALLACGDPAPADGAAAAADTAAAAPPVLGTPSRLLAATEGLRQPLAVLHDPEQDVYFVSSAGAAVDDTTGGFVSRVRPDGTVESARFIEAGRGGAKLGSPRGLAIVGRTLWVADARALRAFDRTTGAPAGGIELAATGVARLSGLALGPGGALYATDGATDRVLRVRSAMDVAFPLRGGPLDAPGALAWDSAGERFLIANGGGAALVAWQPADTVAEVVARVGDAVRALARLPSGEVVAASASRAAILVLGNSLRPLIDDVEGVTGMGVDRRRNRLLLTRGEADLLEVWDLAGAGPP